MTNKTCPLCGNERHSAGWSCKNWAIYKNLPFPAPGFVPKSSLVQEKIDELVLLVGALQQSERPERIYLRDLEGLLVEQPKRETIRNDTHVLSRPAVVSYA